MADKLGLMIGRGRTAEVYAWGDGQALKLFFDGLAGGAEREARTSRMALAAGLPVPGVSGIVEVNGRVGIIFERIDGPSMLQRVGSRPQQFVRLARRMAELHAQMHSLDSADLPSLVEALEGLFEKRGDSWDRYRVAALEALRQLPDDQSICHLDFHPGNILIAVHGPVIIDWSNGRRGDSLADVARTRLLFEMAPLPEDARLRWIAELIQPFFREYLKRYRELRPFRDEDLEAWVVPTLAMRLLDDSIPEERKRIEGMLEQHLKAGA